MAYVDETAYAERFTRRELDQVLASNGDGTLAFARAASDASETVDSYLAAIPGRTFSLPLTAPPARVVGVTADLTRYELWAQRASEEVRNRRDQAIEYLKDLVTGDAVLIVEETLPEDPVVSPVGRVGFRTNGRTFTDRSLAGYVGAGPCCPDPLGGLRGCD